MKIDSPELLDEFLNEQPAYSSDFKALVLRVHAKNGGDIGRTESLTGVPGRTLYSWVSAWNSSAGDKKKL